MIHDTTFTMILLLWRIDTAHLLYSLGFLCVHLALKLICPSLIITQWTAWPLKIGSLAHHPGHLVHVPRWRSFFYSSLVDRRWSMYFSNVSCFCDEASYRLPYLDTGHTSTRPPALSFATSDHTERMRVSRRQLEFDSRCTAGSSASRTCAETPRNNNRISLQTVSSENWWGQTS